MLPEHLGGLGPKPARFASGPSGPKHHGDPILLSHPPPRFRKRLPLDPIPTLHRSVQQRQPWETDAVCVKMMCLCFVHGMVIPPSMELFTGEPAETRFHEQSDMVSRRFSLERPSTNPETP